MSFVLLLGGGALANPAPAAPEPAPTVAMRMARIVDEKWSAVKNDHQSFIDGDGYRFDVQLTGPHCLYLYVVAEGVNPELRYPQRGAPACFGKGELTFPLDADRYRMDDGDGPAAAHLIVARKPLKADRLALRRIVDAAEAGRKVRLDEVGTGGEAKVVAPDTLRQKVENPEMQQLISRGDETELKGGAIGRTVGDDDVVVLTRRYLRTN